MPGYTAEDLENFIAEQDSCKYPEDMLVGEMLDYLCDYATLLREREEVVSKGKLQWDEVARILGVDGDNVDAVFNAAKQVMRERELAKVEDDGGKGCSCYERMKCTFEAWRR